MLSKGSRNIHKKEKEKNYKKKSVPVLTHKETERYCQLRLVVVITGLIDWWIQGDALDVHT